MMKGLTGKAPNFGDWGRVEQRYSVLKAIIAVYAMRECAAF
jgi:hypothetical protein